VTPMREFADKKALQDYVKAHDRAARLAAIPAGESPANRGVQSLL
jgi:hypothetical protein